MEFFVGPTTPAFCSPAVVFGLLIGIVASVPTSAQSLVTPAIVPAFQSVSITPSQSAKPFMRINTQDGTANFTGYSLQDLIQYAYGVNAPQISGAPDWIASLKYDINAKAPGDNAFTFEQMKNCVEALLATQFNLVFHRENRVLPIYELVVAAEGLKLESPQFGGAAVRRSRIVFTPGHVEASSVNMSAFAQDLAGQTGTFVVDKTGIAASYDFTMDWTPSQNPLTSISEALERQLGLQLNPTTGPVELFVIDRVEKAHAIPRST
jgi:uncharacterized protein (TIGR03435 family)